MTSDEAIHDLLERYHRGIYHGDTEILAGVFHPEARYATVAGGELRHLDMETYFPIVEERESPESLGEPFAWHLESLQLAGPATACARVRSEMLGKRFDDFLSLVRIDGEWRVLAKVFHFDEAG